MNYQQQLKQFITSQHLFTGARITCGVLIPAIILYRYGLLGSMIALPMGALFSALSDPPGPPNHRRNGLKAGLVIYVLMLVVGGFSRHHPWLIAIELVIFGTALSLISIFGARASSIGLIGLIAFILNTDPTLSSSHVFLQALWLVCGIAWYSVFSLLFYNIRPYRPIQHELGECLMKIGTYLRSRALFFKPGTDISKLMGTLFAQQLEIHHHQEQLREMFFSTRKLISESTQKGRSLMMIFIDSVDLLERIMTAQQIYPQLMEAFKDDSILPMIHRNVQLLANTLEKAGLSIQSDERASAGSIQKEYRKTLAAFNQLRKEKLTPSTVESFIILRHIMYSLEDITARVERISLYSAYKANQELEFRPPADPNKFKPHVEISFPIFWSNITLKSQNFRHALRVAIALLCGYLVSLLFQVGHGHWILLTIATIIKPAYGLSKQRNIHRLTGTFIGAAIAFSILFIDLNSTLLFALMMLTMVIAYSTLRLNYGLSTAFLTMFILISFRFLHPQGISDLLVDRVIDTIIGSVIAFLVSLFVLPSWESENMNRLVIAAIEKNRAYFEVVAAGFLGRPVSVTAYKVARKESFIALANLSDNFQKIISEPKRQRSNLEHYHQFVSSSHMLTSQIAALSAQLQRFGSKYAGDEFLPLIKAIEYRFDKALQEDVIEENKGLLKSNSLQKKIQQLLTLRREEIAGEREESGLQTRKTLSELKTITDQFGLIAATLSEVNSIRGKLV
ncbi:MAG TPA: FUSC family membrane protein [Flavitalea sp.]|nr:FUSC family membrane protein [Flavitalea sp.]